MNKGLKRYSVKVKVRFRGERRLHTVTAFVEAGDSEEDTIRDAMVHNVQFGVPGRGCGKWLPSPLEKACEKLEPFICGVFISDTRIVEVKEVPG